MSSTQIIAEERIEPVAWRPKSWRRFVGNMSNSKFYEERKAGRIETVKMGAATLVITSPRQYVAALRDGPLECYRRELPTQRTGESKSKSAPPSSSTTPV